MNGYRSILPLFVFGYNLQAIRTRLEREEQEHSLLIGGDVNAVTPPVAATNSSEIVHAAVQADSSQSSTISRKAISEESRYSAGSIEVPKSVVINAAKQTQGGAHEQCVAIEKEYDEENLRSPYEFSRRRVAPAFPSEDLISMATKSPVSQIEVKLVLDFLIDHPTAVECKGVEALAEKSPEDRETLRRDVEELVKQPECLEELMSALSLNAPQQTAAKEESLVDSLDDSQIRSNSADAIDNDSFRHTVSSRPMSAVANSLPNKLRTKLRARALQYARRNAVELSPWAMLQAKYTCSICLDVLAAPTVLHCSHSFCGACLTDYVESCVSCMPESVEVVKSCPECRTEFTTYTYEKLLDEDIACQAEAIDRSRMSTVEEECRDSWRKRRSQFLELTRARRRERSRANAQEEADEEAEMLFYEHLLLAGTIALTVLAIIAISRARRN